jgi:hypothetical protein
LLSGLRDYCKSGSTCVGGFFSGSVRGSGVGFHVGAGGGRLDLLQFFGIYQSSLGYGYGSVHGPFLSDLFGSLLEHSGLVSPSVDQALVDLPPGVNPSGELALGSGIVPLVEKAEKSGPPESSRSDVVCKTHQSVPMSLGYFYLDERSDLSLELENVLHEQVIGLGLGNLVSVKGVLRIGGSPADGPYSFDISISSELTSFPTPD